MRKGWFLSTCDTCKRILNSLPTVQGMEWQDIKKEAITQGDLELMLTRSGSVEAIFSKKSRNYRARGLHERVLSDAEMRQLILEDYTFLKRPIAILDEHIFIGNSPSEVSRLQEAMHSLAH
jgi:arsenate reductase (glutaredoxin)